MWTADTGIQQAIGKEHHCTEVSMTTGVVVTRTMRRKPFRFAWLKMANLPNAKVKSRARWHGLSELSGLSAGSALEPLYQQRKAKEVSTQEAERELLNMKCTCGHDKIAHNFGFGECHECGCDGFRPDNKAAFKSLVEAMSDGSSVPFPRQRFKQNAPNAHAY